jgi:HSP20 family protein
MPGLTGLGWFPAINVSESETEFTLTAELPGLTAQDVSIDYTDGVLTLRGDKPDELRAGAEAGRRWYVCERPAGPFQRALPLPGGIAADRITATFTDGVLTVHLPKVGKPPARHHAIPITAP